MTSAQRNAVLAIFAIALVSIGLWWSENNLDEYKIQVLNLIAINAILAVSLNLIYGITGMFSLGHAGFMAVGAYVCTLFILSPEQKESMWLLEPIIPILREASLPFFWAVFAGGLIAAIAGLCIAVPVLRLGGDYLGIATLGFAEIIRVVITNASTLTNGALGVKGIPQYATLWWNYGWLLLTLYFVVMLLKSNVGNVLRAIREDEIAAKTMGVNTFRYKVLSFSIGAFFAGIGGALMAAFISTIDPKMFNFLLTFNVLMIVVAGGLGSISGSVIGSVFITFMLEWLRAVESPFTFLNYDVPGIPGMRMVVFSLLLMFVILFWRRGLMGMNEITWESLAKLVGRNRGDTGRAN